MYNVLFKQDLLWCEPINTSSFHVKAVSASVAFAVYKFLLMRLKINVIQCTQYDSSTFLRSPRDFSAHSFLKTYLFRAKWDAEGTSPWEVYNVVTFEARVPCVVSATCKVGQPICTCIYRDGVRPDVIWCVTSQSIWCFQATPKSVLLFWSNFYWFGFLAAVLGVGKCFLQWISSAKVPLRVNGRDFGY